MQSIGSLFLTIKKKHYYGNNVKMPITSRQKLMKTKNEYTESRASELKEWSAQIDLLATKAEKSAGVVKLKYDPLIDDLRAKQHAAADMMKKLEDASDDAWGLKEVADKLWDGLRSALANAALTFK
jgi:DNA mismatch repair ATPase MutS